MEEKEKTDSFIALLEQKKAAIKEDKNKLANVLKSIQSLMERYYDNESTFVKQTIMLNQYAELLQRTMKDHIPMHPRCSTKEIVEDTTSLIESVIEEVQTIGLPQLQSKIVSKDITINNTQTQTQKQEQNIVIEAFLDSIKDEMNGRQRKELLAIANEAKDTKEAHKSIVEKLKEYGIDVSASIVANILTNPKVWSSLSSLL